MIGRLKCYYVLDAWLTYTSQEESLSMSWSNQDLGGPQTQCRSLEAVWVKKKKGRTFDISLRHLCTDHFMSHNIVLDI